MGGENGAILRLVRFMLTITSDSFPALGEEQEQKLLNEIGAIWDIEHSCPRHDRDRPVTSPSIESPTAREA